MEFIKKYRNKILIALLLVVVATVPITYFLVWRPSDGDYKALLGDLSTMNTAQEALHTGLGVVKTPADLSSLPSSKLAKDASDYNDALQRVSKSPAIAKDAVLASAFNKNKSGLESYNTSVQDLTASLQNYELILTKCANLVNAFPEIKTVSTFDAAAVDCNKAISTAKAGKSNAFKEQYLNAYLQQASALIEAYRQYTKLLETKTPSISYATIVATIQKITDLDTTKLDLTPSVDVSSSLKTLTDSATAQQKAFFR